MLTDAQLLCKYCDEGSEAAFAEFVARHVDRVYAVALRKLGGRAHAAREVAQQVFLDLSRKARALSERPSVVGWLHVSAQRAATQYIRGEARRWAREQRAFMINAETPGSPVESAMDRQKLHAWLDDAISDLAEKDREAILLRFGEGKPLADVGRLIGLSEDSARKRIDRALEKVRRVLQRRGITSTAGALSVVLGEAVSAAPAGLAVQISSAVTAATVTSSAGAIVALLAMNKLTSVALVSLLLAGVATTAFQYRARAALQRDAAELQEEIQMLPLYLQREQIVTRELIQKSHDRPDVAALDRVRQRRAQLKKRPPGILDAEMEAPTNLGRATPQAAAYTLTWALNTRNLDALASSYYLADDRPESRDAFMALMSDAVRTKYQTPERFVTDALTSWSTYVPVAAFQVTDVSIAHGGMAKVSMWLRLASGYEFPRTIVVVPTPKGWGGMIDSLDSESFRQNVFKSLDPQTGERLPQPAKASTSP